MASHRSYLVSGLLAAAALAVLSTTAAPANTITNYGTNGVGAGVPGGAATANASGNSDSSNTANAVGGGGGYPFNPVTGNSYTGDGGDGGYATATAGTGPISGSALASAAAIGGGGYGWGAGNHGGNGSQAKASASAASTNGGYVSVTAIQTGGTGGAGLGILDNPGTGGMATGGNGASSVMTNAVTGSTTGNLVLDQSAVGGDGGGEASIGGTAGYAASKLIDSNMSLTEGLLPSALSLSSGATGGSARESASGQGPLGGYGQALASATDATNLNITASATGGTGGEGLTGGGNGGYAMVTAIGKSTGTAAGTSGVSVSANATGGGGGSVDVALPNPSSNGGNGGGAIADASGENAGPDTVTVSASATGGNGGEGISGAGLPGNAAVSAVGESTGGGQVQVSTIGTAGTAGWVQGGTPGDYILTGGDGGDETLSNTVAGTTTGELDLTQEADGGAAVGGFTSGNGGNGSSSLIYNYNTIPFPLGYTPSLLKVDSIAKGGAPGATDRSLAGNAGNATAIANITAATNLVITAEAQGGFPGALAFTPGSHGGAANANAVAASTISDGGSVTVNASATGGTGGYGGGYLTGRIQGPSGPGGNATAFASGTNASSAPVKVTATATGGAGGYVGDTQSNGGVATASAVGLSTGGGDVTVTVNQFAGTGAASVLTTTDGGGAGNAIAGSTTGALVLIQNATSSGASNGPGYGNASSTLDLGDLNASPLANGYLPSSITLESNAVGAISTAEAGVTAATNLTVEATATDHGSEFTGATATATGISTSLAAETGGVNVMATATCTSTSDGLGAPASATAVGGNASTDALTVLASATAGLGAAATASATGTAEFSRQVMVNADAVGSVDGFYATGPALADAYAGGVGGTVTAQASDSGAGVQVQATAAAPIVSYGGSEHTEAFANVYGPVRADYQANGLQTATFVTALPSLYEVNQTLTPSVKNAMASAGDNVLGLMLMSMENMAPGATPYHSQIDYTVPLSSLTNPYGDLVLGLLSSRYTGAGMVTLLITLNNGSAGIDQAFESFAMAQAYFNDHPLNLGSAQGDLAAGSSLTLDITLNVIPSYGDSSFDPGVAVGAPVPLTSTPEPSTLMLLAAGGVLGLALLTRRPRRKMA